jgi:hypothetical protein
MPDHLFITDVSVNKEYSFRRGFVCGRPLTSRYDTAITTPVGHHDGCLCIRALGRQRARTAWYTWPYGCSPSWPVSLRHRGKCTKVLS